MFDPRKSDNIEEVKRASVLLHSRFYHMEGYEPSVDSVTLENTPRDFRRCAKELLSVSADTVCNNLGADQKQLSCIKSWDHIENECKRWLKIWNLRDYPLWDPVGFGEENTWIYIEEKN